MCSASIRSWVKKLGPELQRLRAFSGSAVLGDGRPALIIEPAEIAGMGSDYTNSELDSIGRMHRNMTEKHEQISKKSRATLEEERFIHFSLGKEEYAIPLLRGCAK